MVPRARASLSRVVSRAPRPLRILEIWGTDRPEARDSFVRETGYFWITMRGHYHPGRGAVNIGLREPNLG